jgi:transposase
VLLKTVLNQVHPLKLFVYAAVALVADAVEVTVEPRKGSKPTCDGCGKRGPTYDTARIARWFEFVPLWGMPVRLRYWMRRVDCRGCGVTTERVPWADGKHRTCNVYRLFLARWAKRLSWSEVATVFGTSWGVVYRSVQWVVAYGLKHRDLSGVRAIGIDEIAVWSRHRYVTVVYQIDAGARRLLWIGRTRKKKALEKFFSFWGKRRTRALEFVCSDMWRAYLTVVAKKAGHVLHVLDRFHIVANMNKALDKVRAGEAREMARAGYEPVLANSRWCFLKRKKNMTKAQRLKLADVLSYNLRTVRAYLLKESLQALWKYERPEAAEWFLGQWCTRALRSRIEPIKRFARTLREHTPLIINYFRAKKEISNGAVEAFNLGAKFALRKARGFRTYEALEVALYHQLGRLPEPKFTHAFC